MFNEVNRRIAEGHERMKWFRRFFYVFFGFCFLAFVAIALVGGMQAIRLIDWIVAQ